MRFFTKLSEREIDGILAGKVSDGELEDVATFVREMRSSLAEAPPPAVEAGHLAGIFEEARRVHPSASERQIPSRAPRRVRNPFRRLAARATIAAVGLAALAAFGGAAYAGVLPAPVQGGVADLAGKVGLSLPGNGDHSKPRGGGSGGVQQHNGGETGQSNVDQPAQGNGDQGSGDQGNRNQGEGDQGNGGANNNETNGDQGNGDQGSSTSEHQTEQGPQGAHNEQTTPSGGSGADGGKHGDGQQGDGAGAGDGNQNG